MKFGLKSLSLLLYYTGGRVPVDTGAIIGGMVAVIFIIAVTVIILTVICRRKQSKEIVLEYVYYEQCSYKFFI